MATTIQVQDDTVELLKRFRESLKASSYDEVVKRLVRESLARKSMWGRLAGKRKYSMKEILEGLRDETDRF